MLSSLVQCGQFGLLEIPSNVLWWLSCVRPTFNLFIELFTLRFGWVYLVCFGGCVVMLCRNLPVVDCAQVFCHFVLIAAVIRLFISL